MKWKNTWSLRESFGFAWWSFILKQYIPRYKHSNCFLIKGLQNNLSEETWPEIMSPIFIYIFDRCFFIWAGTASTCGEIIQCTAIKKSGWQVQYELSDTLKVSCNFSSKRHWQVTRHRWNLCWLSAKSFLSRTFNNNKALKICSLKAPTL